MPVSMVRYALCGGALFALDFLVFLWLVEIAGASVPIAQIMARSTGAIAGFFIHRHYSFRDLRVARGTRSVGTEASAYAVLTIVMIFWSPFVIAAGVWALNDIVLGKLFGEVFLFLQVYAASRWIFAGSKA